MKYFEESGDAELKFILAFYKDDVIHHEYNKFKNELSAGKSLTDQTIRDLFVFLNKEKINAGKYCFSSMMKYHVLYFSEETRNIVWITEPQVNRMLFTKEHPMKSGKYPMPRLVWQLDSNGLTIYAIKKDDKITPATKLYYGPFLNVNGSGTVCMGTAHFNDTLMEYNQIIENVHYNFFNSVFTHTNYNNIIKGNYVEWCKANINKKVFNDKDLVLSNKTLKNIFNGKST